MAAFSFKNFTKRLAQKFQMLGRWMTRKIPSEEMVVATTLLLPKTRKVVVFTICWFIGGLLLFHIAADFTKTGWQNIYHLWDKTRDSLFFLILMMSLPKYRSLTATIFIYTIVRLCFQIIT